MNLKYSVAMATYNGEKYIKKQIDSILSQTVLPEEVVIIDDFSTDNTFRILREYEFPDNINVMLKKHIENMGYRKTFFEAINLCSQKVIFLSDQDDVWINSKAEKILKVFNNNSRISVINTNYKLIDSVGEEIQENKWINRRKILFRNKISKIDEYSIVRYNISMGCTMAITQEIVDEIKAHKGQLQNMLLPHDWAINVIGALNDSLYYYNEPLIYYRLHDKNTLGLNRDKSIEKRCNSYNIIMNQKKDMKKIISLCQYNNQRLSNYMDAMIDMYQIMIYTLSRKSLLEYIKMAIKYHEIRYFSFKTILYDCFLLLKKM